MSEQHTAQPGDDHAKADELLRGLELFRLDPQLESVLEGIADTQEGFAACTTEEAHAELRRINRVLETTGWLGGPVEVTGKLRLASWCNSEDAYSDHVASDARPGSDADGEYYEVAGLPMVFMLVNTDKMCDDEGGCQAGRIVLTFTTPDVAIDAEEDDEDLTADTAGEYFIYPEDIVEMSFRDPSVAQSALDLERHFPAIYARLLRDVSVGTPAGHLLLGSLKHFEFPIDDRITRQLLMQIGDVVYDRLCPDSGSGYEFSLDGQIASVAVDTGLVWETMRPHSKLSGVVVGIDFMPVDDMYRAVFVVSEETVAYDGGYEIRIIPVDSVEKLRCLRPSRRRFGERALLTFESPDEVAEYWREVQGEPKSLPELASDAETPPQSDDDIFAELTSDLALEMVEQHDPVIGADLISVQADVTKISEDFADHVRAFEELDMDVPLSDSDVHRIAQLMEKTMQRLEHMRLGETLVVEGDSMVLDDRDEKTSDIILITEGTKLVGTIENTVICQIPEMAFSEESSGDTTHSTVGVGVLLSDCKLIEGDELHDTPFSSGTVIVVITPDQGSKFYQIAAA